MSWASKFSKSYRVGDGKKFRLKDHDPGDTANLTSEERARELLAKGVARMAELQDKLYAQDRWALLLIFQGMDAAGKDGVIKHVMSGISPLGCQIYAFKTPSEEDLDHDYLWRHVKCLPQRGRIGIFNRSHYEEVLIVRVHPEILANERMPAPLVTKKIWQERFEDICAFEHYLSRNGFVIRKFFLHVSKKEQKKRILDRLQRPEKNWKFSAPDLQEREHWDEYMDAYEEAIANTATPQAPWFVIPADNKWFTRLAVAAAIVDTLDGLNLAYPKVDAQKKKELEAARKVLLSNKRG
jgi:PPK2 family polyphosphate:nucleotide phosphotransferase